MDELGVVWLSPQSEDDLRHRILLTSFELETVKMEVDKIRHQSEMNQKQLHAQLQLAFEERDEARRQLQQLLEIFMLASSTNIPIQLQTLTGNPSEMATFPTKPNSGITDHQSNNDVDSFFDTVSSTEKSCKITDDCSKQYDDELNSNRSPMVLGACQRRVDLDQHLDNASIVIDQLVNGKVLPCKGRLLEAVMKAGPTLQAIMMLSGPLPQWKNPPPVIQPLGFQAALTNNGMLTYKFGVPNPRVYKPSLKSSMHEQSTFPSQAFNSPCVEGAGIVDVTDESACSNNYNKKPRMV